MHNVQIIIERSKPYSGLREFYRAKEKRQSDKTGSNPHSGEKKTLNCNDAVYECFSWYFTEIRCCLCMWWTPEVIFDG